jgi:hypothetical protein
MSQVQMQYSFSKFFSMQVQFSCFLIKGREREKKRVWRQVCEWLSVAVACLPAAVSLLLLEPLFMQISGVSLALTWPRRLCLLRVLLCTSLRYKLSPFQAHSGRWHCTCFLRLACLFTAHVGNGSSPFSCGVFLPPPFLQAFPLSRFWLLGMCCCSCWPECLFTAHMGGGSSPLSCGVFLPPPISQAFPLLVAGCAPRLWPSLARPRLFIYSSGKDSPPPLFSAQGTPHSLLCVFIVLIAYYSVSLFLLGGGPLCWSGPGLSVEVLHTT